MLLQESQCVPRNVTVYYIYSLSAIECAILQRKTLSLLPLSFLRRCEQ